MLQESLLDYIHKKAIRKRIPFSVQFDLTYSCNLDCIHCYVTKEDRPELKTSEIKNILKKLASAGTLYLDFSGGEIFLREDFFEIAEYARELNFSLSILTNGTLINEDVADKIANLNLQNVSLSIYSTTPHIHDMITNTAGSLEKTIKAAKLLRDRNIKVRINYAAMKQNINDFHKVYELSQDIGAKFRGDSMITPKIDGDLDPVCLRIDDEELYSLWNDEVLQTKSDYRLINSKDEFSDILCIAGHSFCYISPYGDVFPCVQFPIFCGNLKEKSFEEIWYHSEKMLNISNLKFSQLPACFECEIKEYCRFCPGVVYLEEGNIFAKSNSICKETKIRSKIVKEGD